MKYFHRTHLPPAEVLAGSASYFGQTLAPVEQQPRRRQFAGTIGRISVTVQAEGGH
jgi:hypothetical protein